MPIYEYECRKCGETHEILQKISEGLKRKCPSCGAMGLRKLVSAAAFQLKGTGWYVTDFRDKGKKKEKGDGKEKTDGKGESKSDKSDKSESKSESKADSKESKGSKAGAAV